MRNPFKFRGFDSIIGKGITFQASSITIGVGQTMVIEGEVRGPDIIAKSQIPDMSKTLPSTVFSGGEVLVDDQAQDKAKKSKPDLKTTLAVRGIVHCANVLNVPNLIVTGEVHVDLIVCEGTLAIKSGAKIVAKALQYRNLVIEDGAVVLGKMSHLDYVSAGERQ